MRPTRAQPRARPAAAPRRHRAPGKDAQSTPTPGPRPRPVRRPPRLRAASNLPRGASQRGSARGGQRYLGDEAAAAAPALGRRAPSFRGCAPRTDPEARRPAGAHRSRKPCGPRTGRGSPDPLPPAGGASEGKEPTPRPLRQQHRGTKSPSPGAPLRERQPIGAAAGPFLFAWSAIPLPIGM